MPNTALNRLATPAASSVTLYAATTCGLEITSQYCARLICASCITSALSGSSRIKQV